jgi:hypothetical protein
MESDCFAPTTVTREPWMTVTVEEPTAPPLDGSEGGVG